MPRGIPVLAVFIADLNSGSKKFGLIECKRQGHGKLNFDIYSMLFEYDDGEKRSRINYENYFRNILSIDILFQDSVTGQKPPSFCILNILADVVDPDEKQSVLLEIINKGFGIYLDKLENGKTFI